MREVRGDSSRERVANRGQAVRDDDGVRLHRPEEPAEPEFVRSDVGDQEIVGREDVPELPEDALGFHRTLGTFAEFGLESFQDAFLRPYGPGRLPRPGNPPL